MQSLLVGVAIAATGDPCANVPAATQPCITEDDCGWACTTLDAMLDGLEGFETVKECRWGTLIEFPGAESFYHYAFDLDGELVGFRYDCWMCGVSGCCDGDTVFSWSEPLLFGDIPEHCPARLHEEDDAVDSTGAEAAADGCGCSSHEPGGGTALLLLTAASSLRVRSRRSTCRRG